MWYKYFGSHRKLCVLVLEEDGETVGILPLVHLSRHKFPLSYTMTETMGGELSDYGGIILDDRDQTRADRALEVLGRYLAGHRMIVVFNQVPETSKLHALARDRRFSATLRVTEKMASVNYYVELPPLLEDYYASLNKKMLKNLRRINRNLEKLGELRIRRATGDTIENDLHSLWALYNGKLARKNLPALDKGTREFYSDFYRELARKGELDFNLLEVDGSPVAINVGFKQKEIYYFYMTMYDDRYYDYSPGNIIVLNQFRYLYDNGFKEMDFLRGDESYKSKMWRASSRQNSRLIVVKQQPLSGLIARYADLRWRFGYFRQHGLIGNYNLYVERKRNTTALART